ncbi:DNA replication protein [Zalerion maritima]|uniref:DNA replication complex GINS protein PSF3 n=1 Tax=Zalerion maritima TaxID=339359 RepID=A0AAD5RVH4_9PEZI|nr:DNA replication protein [Zalerion maritima]
MSYYDIDAILTEAERVPATFNHTIPLLGYLDNSPSLKAGTTVPLPLWLAEMLALASAGPSQQHSQESTSFTSLTLPSSLSTSVSQALKADPRAVALRDQSAHFYALGVRMLDLFEEPELGDVLRRTFVTRAGDVVMHARKAGSGTDDALGVGAQGEEFLRGLEEWERQLFRRAHDGAKGRREWMDGVKN